VHAGFYDASCIRERFRKKDGEVWGCEAQVWVFKLKYLLEADRNTPDNPYKGTFCV
jgi:hypothetical protein